MRALRRLVATLVLAVACTACRADIAIDVTMKSDGSGVVTVSLSADPELVAKAPGLASDLRIDDIKAAGWSVSGPTATPEGGLQLELTQAFGTPAQANAILADLNSTNGPLLGITLARSKVRDTTTFTLNGRLQVLGGLDAFSDPDLFTALGATPYSAQIAAAGQQPGDVVGVTFAASLPGTVNTTTATGGNGLLWTVPLDGSVLDVGTLSDTTISRNTWAKPVAKSALVALVVWGVVAVGFILYVAVARRRRRSPKFW